MEVESFSAPRAAQAIGCTFRQLDYWIRMGVLTPSVPARGTGHRRGFSLHDVAVGRAVHQLMRLGATAPVAAEAATTLADRPLDRWSGPVLVTTAGAVVPVAEAEAQRLSGWLIRLDRCTRREPRTLAA